MTIVEYSRQRVTNVLQTNVPDKLRPERKFRESLENKMLVEVLLRESKVKTVDEDIGRKTLAKHLDNKKYSRRKLKEK